MPDSIENKAVEPAELSQEAERDAAEIMRKYDRESNTRIWEGKAALIVRLVTVSFSLYCIWSTLFSVAALEKRLTAFLGLILLLGYLYYPADKRHVRPNHLPWYDILLMLLGSGAFFFYCLRYDVLVKILTSASRMTPVYTIIGIVAILCLAELCRRCVGLPILCVVAVLLIYTFSTGIGIERVLYTLFYSTSGVLSTPIQVCAKYIVVFIIFGAFLERTGIAAFFVDLANSLVGGFSGGPAKVAVISSALCGMVSGSSVGNTVTTGSVTIPMMKKTGYQGEFAGAVEAAASTGGQIMPPIMGAAAFLMAEYLNVTYADVAMRAILPAALYFAGIFIAVHLEAKKLKLRGMSRESLPRFGQLIRRIYLLLPLVMLVALVVANARTLQFAASVSILIALLCTGKPGYQIGAAAVLLAVFFGSEDLSLGFKLAALACVLVAFGMAFIEKEGRIGLPKILEALEAGGKSSVTVAVACSMAGLIAGCITATGLASKIISAVVSVSRSVSFLDPTVIALFLTMICCIILGMGVPTTANYCIMASTCAPILITIGVPKIAAHFFVFYFGIVADITPPVALAAYAGSAIAKSDPMKTGINATKLAIGAFVVPYIFCLNPAMLFIDTSTAEVVLIVATSLVGIFGLAAAMNGYLFRKLRWPERGVLCIGGLLMMDPSTTTDLIGAVLLVGAILFLYFSSRKKAAEAS